MQFNNEKALANAIKTIKNMQMVQDKGGLKTVPVPTSQGAVDKLAGELINKGLVGDGEVYALLIPNPKQIKGVEDFVKNCQAKDLLRPLC